MLAQCHRRLEGSWHRRVVALSAALALSSCANPATKYGADSIDRIDKGNGGTPTYMAMGKLDYDNDPRSTATRVMLAACPLGAPMLMAAMAQHIQGQTYSGTIWIAMFTCNDAIK